ncbi:hypothetical protein [Janthinobacterium sp. B9-8]|uniref:hypothetical protein n=1 Tax=Janthinobacterium sp. B9-8 TaxID=1236179 RepID=UPI0012E39CD7|nr:hypothetical protein [Janthinobacterium sp. B9-8]
MSNKNIKPASSKKPIANIADFDMKAQGIFLNADSLYGVKIGSIITFSTHYNGLLKKYADMRKQNTVNEKKEYIKKD